MTGPMAGRAILRAGPPPHPVPCQARGRRCYAPVIEWPYIGQTATLKLPTTTGPRQMDQADPADRLLEHIPAIDLPFDGNYRHANGLDLPVIVINLARRVDRWETLCRRMSAAGLTRLIKAPAIDGTHLPEAQIVALMGSHGKNVDEA